MKTIHTTDVAIIGAGPVGLFAVFELGMLKINAHVIDALDSVGGQCAALYPEKPIYDIPGYPAIDAQDLVKQLHAQAAPFKPTYHLGQQVTQIKRRPHPTPLPKGEGSTGYAGAKNTSPAGRGRNGEAAGGEAISGEGQPTTGEWQLVTSAGTVIHAKAILIAAGCGAFGPNRPPLEGLEAFEASGAVRYLVTRKDEFKGKRIVIAGGGDSAIDWANILAPEAAACYVVHRREKFRAMPESVAQMHTLIGAGDIELVVPYQLAGLEGENGQLTGVVVSTLDGEQKVLGADYLLPFYGLSMDLGPIADWGLNLHMNHIQVNPATCETSTPGIFAIGDIATYDKKLKLILCGFSEAAMAAHAIREIVYPDTPYHFEYSTTRGVPGAAA